MIRICDLEGELLAIWAAKANGFKVYRDGECQDGSIICHDEIGMIHSFSEYGWRPDLSWETAGSIIEREKIEFTYDNEGIFYAGFGDYCDEDGDHDWLYHGYGTSHLIAAMRAFVMSKFGEEVQNLLEA